MRKTRLILKTVAFSLVLLLIIQMLPLSTLATELSNNEIVEQAILESVENIEDKIVAEVETLRDEYTKHFRCEDGSYIAAVYNEPIHYEENGDWKEIDNSLIAVDSSNAFAQTASTNSAQYSVSKRSTPITFPENINTGKITISNDNNIISFGVKNSAPKDSFAATVSEPSELVSFSITNSENQNSTAKSEDKNALIAVDSQSNAITYSNVFENASIEYEVSSSMIKESIVVSEKSDNYKYEFSINFGSCVPMVDTTSGGIYIYESSQSSKPVMAIAPPYMFDSNNETSDAVTMELVQDENNYTLIVEADEDWMNNLNRKFPVVIDPTFVLDVGRSNIDDIHVNQNFPNTSYKLDYQLEVGKNNNNVYRTYIKYNLPSLPDCSIVTNAELQLIQNWARDFDTTDLYLNVYQCESEWDFDSITWNNQPIQNLSEATIVDYTTYEGGMSAEYNLNITKIVKDWYENGNNHGLMLASSDETVEEKTSFYSSRNIVSNYPVVTIQYVNNTGIEDYWTYDGFSLGESGSAYINMYNGSLTYIHSDVSTNGLIAPLSISHVYLTDERNAEGSFGNMNFGKGFKLSVIEKIEAVDSNILGSNYPYKYIDADGTVHFFVTDSLVTNQYYYEFGSDIVLTSNNSGFVLSSPDGSKKEFNSDGYLTKITDNNGNSVTITYSNGQITKVTDGGGVSVNLSYNSDNTLNYIADSTGRKTYYHYNSSGQLDYVTYPDSSKTLYSYNNNLLLSEITASSGAKASLSYKEVGSIGNTFYKVSSYTTYGEDSSTVYDTVSFEYRTNDTHVENTKGDTIVLAFDNSGRVIGKTINGKTLTMSKYNDVVDGNGNYKNTLNYSTNSFSATENLLEAPYVTRDYFRWINVFDNPNQKEIKNMNTERLNYAIYSEKLTRSGEGYLYTQTEFKSVVPLQTYTVSAYVNIQDTLSTGEVYLRLTAGNDEGSLCEVKSPSITTTDNEWRLLTATITAPETAEKVTIDCGMFDAIGTVYVDSVWMEEGNASGRHNLVRNSSFDSSSTRWNTSNSNGYSTITVNPSDGSNAVLINGEPNRIKYENQSIELAGNAGDVLVFGASAQALCSASGNNGHRFFGIRIILKHQTEVVQAAQVSFDKNAYNTMQSVMSSITAESNFNEIEISLCYEYEINSAIFDDVFVYRDYYKTEYEYDSKGRIEKAVSDNGQAVEYYRGGLDGVGLDINSVTAYANGQVTQTTGYSYDSNHNITTATGSDGVTTSYTYNNKGLPLTTAVSAGDGLLTSSTSYTYTADNNYLKSVTDATGSTTEYTYNSRGLVSKVTDPNGNVTEYEYDPNTDALISVSNPSDDLGNPSTQFEYDDAGRISAIDTGVVEWYYYYDVFGKTEMADNNFDTTLFLNYYDEEDRLQTQEYFNYDYVDFTYDDEDRVTSESYNGVLTYEYLYSNDGMLGKVVDHESNEEWNYQYDLMNRPIRITSGDGRDIYYEYNNKNELSHFKVSDSGSKLLETTYTYDSSGRVMETQFPSMQGTPSQTYSYDLLGRNDGFTNYYNGTDSVETVYSFRVVNGNQTSQVQSLTYYNGNDVFAIDLDYQYDANGNITQISYDDTPLIKYYYDGLNRLIREDNTYINKTVVYAYDNEGDLLSKTEYELTFEDSLGEAVDIVTRTYAYGRHHNALTSYDGDTDFSYDASGNPLTYRSYTMSWAKGRQLKTVSKNGLSMQFKYNQSGIRTSKTVNGVKTEYTYVGDMLVSQKTGNEVINFAYTAGGAPLGFTYNGTPYFYLLNLQGDIISIYDSTGEIVVDYIYDTWGKLISITGTLADTIGVKNPLRYRGYYYDTETSLYYLQSRYYDPETCRFINADAYVIAGDDYIQGTNMYAYCYNNPVMYVDPTGMAGKFLGGLFDFVSGLFQKGYGRTNESFAEIWMMFLAASDSIGFTPYDAKMTEIETLRYDSGVVQVILTMDAYPNKNSTTKRAYTVEMYYGKNAAWSKENIRYSDSKKNTEFFLTIVSGVVSYLNPYLGMVSFIFDLSLIFIDDDYEKLIDDMIVLSSENPDFFYFDILTITDHTTERQIYTYLEGWR